MNIAELSSYDGKEGRKAYIGYKGKVYDVTESKFWKNGTHMRKVEAGRDLTSQLSAAPHGEDKILALPFVADIDVEKAADSKPAKKGIEYYQELYHKFHPHPISVHFPMGIFPLAFISQMLAIFLGGNIFFAFTTCFAMVVATLFTVPAVLTGFLSFFINFGGKTNKFLKIKIVLSILLFILGVIASYIGITLSPLAPLFTWIVIMTVPIVLIIGFCGGKLTWPD